MIQGAVDFTCFDTEALALNIVECIQERFPSNDEEYKESGSWFQWPNGTGVTGSKGSYIFSEITVGPDVQLSPAAMPLVDVDLSTSKHCYVTMGNEAWNVLMHQRVIWSERLKQFIVSQTRKLFDQDKYMLKFYPHHNDQHSIIGLHLRQRR